MKTVTALTLAFLLHIALFFSQIFKGYLARPLKPSETLFEISTVNKGFNPGNKTRSQVPLSAKALGLGGGLRVGAFQVDPGEMHLGNSEGSESKMNELGLGEGVADGRGGSWANSIVSLKLNGITRELHNWIDSSLYYPKELSENNIEGTVEAILVFDSNGNFIRGQSRFKSTSNYLRTWLVRHLKRLFNHPLSFPIGDKPLRVSAVFEFYLNPPLLYGSFKNAREAGDRRSSFQRANLPKGARRGVFGGKLFFQRNSFKNYGVGLASEEGGSIPAPVIDVLGLVDRLARVLDISEDKKREKYALKFLRDDPEWAGN